MSPPIYHFLHHIGLIILFVGFGALLTTNSSKTAMKWHGIGLVILAISGFGMLAKFHYSYTAPWVLAKYVLWLALGFLPVLARRRVLNPGYVVVLAVIIGSILAYLGYFKPGQA